VSTHSMTFLDRAIMVDPSTQRTLQSHRDTKAACIFCDQSFCAPIVYYDPVRGLLPDGRLFIVVYSLCKGCLESQSLQERCAREYTEDYAAAAATMQKRQRGRWN
jgi:hypothetical protein